ncbi:SH3 domain-containing protein [Streptococcus urinalis]|uniref:SH3 domain-containing protein n=1 Tax=Streptococcus urinalis TaxID=149016 RepID=UPI003878091D
MAEEGEFTLEVQEINVRRSPNLKGEIAASYKKSQTVKYDSKISANGYRWISYLGKSGNRINI